MYNVTFNTETMFSAYGQIVCFQFFKNNNRVYLVHDT